MALLLKFKIGISSQIMDFKTQKLVYEMEICYLAIEKPIKI